jgi:hypothetical protein
MGQCSGSDGGGYISEDLTLRYFLNLQYILSMAVEPVLILRISRVKRARYHRPARLLQ